MFNKIYNIIERLIALMVSLALIYLLVALTISLNNLNIKMESVKEIISSLSVTLKGSWFF